MSPHRNKAHARTSSGRTWSMSAMAGKYLFACRVFHLGLACAGMGGVSFADRHDWKTADNRVNFGIIACHATPTPYAKLRIVAFDAQPVYRAASAENQPPRSKVLPPRRADGPYTRHKAVPTPFPSHHRPGRKNSRVDILPSPRIHLGVRGGSSIGSQLYAHRLHPMPRSAPTPAASTRVSWAFLLPWHFLTTPWAQFANTVKVVKWQKWEISWSGVHVASSRGGRPGGRFIFRRAGGPHGGPARLSVHRLP